MTMWCEHAKSSTLERHDVITAANQDLAPEIQAKIKRTIDRFVDGIAELSRRKIDQFCTC